MSEKTAATWHPYESAEEARRAAEEEARETASRAALIAKRNAWA